MSPGNEYVHVNKTYWNLSFLTIHFRLITYYIMTGRAIVVVKEVFIMETVVFWHHDNS